MTRQKMLQQFNAARLAAVPLVAVRTADAPATMRFLAEDAPTTFPLLKWDAARGMLPINDQGKAEMTKLKILPNETVKFDDACAAALRLPPKSLVFFHNAGALLQSQEPASVLHYVQSLANLRDEYKQNHRMAVVLGPDFVPPHVLSHDIITLNDPLPGPDDMKVVVSKLFANARTSDNRKVAAPTGEALEKSIDALCGLSLFEAEQVAAMCMTEQGFDHNELWERKRVSVEQQRGMTIYRGAEKFSDIIGHPQLKLHLNNRKNGRRRVRTVLVIDEIDKVFGNVENDPNGTRLDAMRQLLTVSENNRWRGMIAAGVGGAGKTLFAKAFGNECGAPTIMLDTGGMESKWQGESESFIRMATDVIQAISGGNVYMIATSNAATVMRPELQRRFTDGIWMFDLMTEAERDATFVFYAKKLELTPKQVSDRKMINDVGWTGAEIRNCCEYAWDTGCTLFEASQFVVSMAQSRVEEIDRLRKIASGRFLDTSRPGTYQYDAADSDQQLKPMLDRVVQVPTSIVNMKES